MEVNSIRVSQDQSLGEANLESKTYGKAKAQVLTLTVNGTEKKLVGYNLKNSGFKGAFARLFYKGRIVQTDQGDFLIGRKSFKKFASEVNATVVKGPFGAINVAKTIRPLSEESSRSYSPATRPPERDRENLSQTLDALKERIVENAPLIHLASFKGTSPIEKFAQALMKHADEDNNELGRLLAASDPKAIDAVMNFSNETITEIFQNPVQVEGYKVVKALCEAIGEHGPDFCMALGDVLAYSENQDYKDMSAILLSQDPEKALRKLAEHQGGLEELKGEVREAAKIRQEKLEAEKAITPLAIIRYALLEAGAGTEAPLDTLASILQYSKHGTLRTLARELNSDDPTQALARIKETYGKDEDSLRSFAAAVKKAKGRQTSFVEREKLLEREEAVRRQAWLDAKEHENQQAARLIEQQEGNRRKGWLFSAMTTRSLDRGEHASVVTALAKGRILSRNATAQFNALEPEAQLSVLLRLLAPGTAANTARYKSLIEAFNQKVTEKQQSNAYLSTLEKLAESAKEEGNGSLQNAIAALSSTVPEGWFEATQQ